MRFSELEVELRQEMQLLYEEAKEHCTDIELEEFVDAMAEFSTALADCVV